MACYVSISLVSRYIWCSFWFLLWHICCSRVWKVISIRMWIFPVFLLILISDFMPLLFEKIVGMISIFLHLLRLIWWPNIWFNLENVLCALERNVYFETLIWNILYMFVRYIWSKCSPHSCLPYWFFVWMTYPLLKVEY